MVRKNYKSKGRQQSNNGYYDGGSYKSLRAIHQHELNNAINDTIRWTRQERETSTCWTQERQKQQNKERPRFSFDATNNSLRHIVRDRKLEDSYFLRERRRRNGFLLPSVNTTTTTTHYSTTEAEGEGLVHPPGWILRYNNNDNNNYNEESSSSSSSSSSLSDSYNNNNNVNVNVNVNVVQKLQTLSLIVFSNYIHDYQHVMGYKTLQTILSLLSSNCLMELSILLCTSTGTTNDDLAVLLGQHSHVERVCLRGSSNGNGGDSRSASATTRSTNLTDAGLLKLIPKTTILQRRQKQQQQQQQQHRQHNDDNNNKKDNNEDDNDNDNESILECWEEEVDEDDADDDNADECIDNVDHTECHDDDDDDDDDDDEEEVKEGNKNTTTSVIIDGIVGSLKLRRLELLDLVVSCGSGSRSSSSEDGIIGIDSSISSISADVILRWFDKCSGITHLSLAGSFFNNKNSSWSIGRTIVLELHKVLPYLEVLDITRCPWVTESLIIRFLEGYCTNNNNNNKEAVAASKKTTSSQSSLMMSSLPIVYYNRGRFTLNEKQKQHLLNSQQQHQDHQDIDAAHDDWW